MLTKDRCAAITYLIHNTTLREEQVPLDRWDIERFFAPGITSDKMYTRHAGWLSDVDRFDAAMFGFSRAEAVATDPQVLMESPSAAALPTTMICLPTIWTRQQIGHLQAGWQLQSWSAASPAAYLR